ncbi:hypothetical protein KAJ61_05535 [Candidatus Parcubacteria bacterium]|nr:hypothetical protein [Candidatus Parcubacteria bacterium]
MAMPDIDRNYRDSDRNSDHMKSGSSDSTSMKRRVDRADRSTPRRDSNPSDITPRHRRNN